MIESTEPQEVESLRPNRLELEFVHLVSSISRVPTRFSSPRCLEWEEFPLLTLDVKKDVVNCRDSIRERGDKKERGERKERGWERGRDRGKEGGGSENYKSRKETSERKWDGGSIRGEIFNSPIFGQRSPYSWASVR